MFNHKKFYLISIVGLLFLASLACQFSVGDVEGGEPGIAQITICKSVDGDQKCEGQAELFEATEKIYASIQIANLSEEDRVAARWFQGTEQLTVGGQDEVVMTNQTGSGYISFFMEPENPFPAGNYSVQVFLNDSLAQTGNFQIEGEVQAASDEPPQAASDELPAAESTVEQAPAPTKGKSVIQSVTTCLTVNDDSQCEAETTTFGPTEVMHASVELVDAPVGAVILVRWLQGEDIIAETPYPLESGGSGFIDFHLSPDAPFPAGPYAVEIYQDEALVERIELVVEGGETAPGDETVSGSETAPGWQTFNSDGWKISANYPDSWEVEETEDSVIFFGPGKTLFYLTGYPTEGPLEEATQQATQRALDTLAGQFGDFQSTEIQPFTLSGLPGLTSDYAYTDNDGDFLNGSTIVVTTDENNTYVIYIEALEADYSAALEDFNGILQTLTFK